MSFGATLYFLVKIFVLPPGLLVGLGALGIVLYPRHRRIGRGLLIATPLLAWLLSMPLFAAWAARPFETDAPLTGQSFDAIRADAIVVLAGGAYRDAPEFGGADNVRPLTLERLRYGAHLQRLTRLPLVVSGGYAPHMASSEAQLMKRALEEDFGIPVAAIEDGSSNTAENARRSRAVFFYRTIVLVTHAMHMQRARGQFERAGFAVVPAPLGFVSNRSRGYVLADLLPTLQGLVNSHYVIYEATGALWYRYAYD